MDIAMMSISLSQANIQQQASLSVMKKAMDQTEVGADFINKMMGDASTSNMQQMIHPYLGTTIDTKA